MPMAKVPLPTHLKPRRQARFPRSDAGPQPPGGGPNTGGPCIWTSENKKEPKPSSDLCATSTAVSSGVRTCYRLVTDNN